MFKDKAFQASVAVDKRGRKVPKTKRKEDMRKYYRLQDEEVRSLRTQSGVNLLQLCATLKLLAQS